MASLSDRLRAEGMQKGMHEGVEGMLRKQIQLKFGPIPSWADQLIAAATDEQLDVWGGAEALGWTLQPPQEPGCGMMSAFTVGGGHADRADGIYDY